MGLRLLSNDCDPIPRQSRLELTCDGDHGLLPPPIEIFADDGFIHQHSSAMAAGWLERMDGGRGRIWLGPCCSGKQRR